MDRKYTENTYTIAPIARDKRRFITPTGCRKYRVAALIMYAAIEEIAGVAIDSRIDLAVMGRFLSEKNSV